MSDALLEAARRRHLSDEHARCPFCGSIYRPHPGFADHRDRCEWRPMNRPHIHGEAVAMYGGDSR